MGRLKYWDDIANEWVEVTVPHHSHSVTSLSTSASEGQIFVSDGNGHVVAADNVGGSGGGGAGGITNGTAGTPNTGGGGGGTGNTGVGGSGGTGIVIIR